MLDLPLFETKACDLKLAVYIITCCFRWFLVAWDKPFETNFEIGHPGGELLCCSGKCYTESYSEISGHCLNNFHLWKCSLC